MAYLISKIVDNYNFVFYELADEKTRDLFPSALSLMIILPLYVYFVKSLGPRLMKDLKPFELRTPIFYYNLFQIIICIYIIYLGSVGGWLNGYNYACQPYDPTDNPKTRMMITAAWWYATVKLIDLLDTVFFVLRKKDRQISFLHVFHHTVMPVAAFIGIKYYPNGHGTLVGYLNSYVHVVMYTYYLISGLGPEYQKYLWWKKHLTSMQLIQFGLIFIHNARILIEDTCDYPKWISYLLCIHSLQFIYMFGTFYINQYVKKPSSKLNNGISNGKVKSEKFKGH